MSEMIDVGAGALGGGAITGAVFWWIINGLKAEIHELRGELRAMAKAVSDVTAKYSVLESRQDRTDTDVRDLIAKMEVQNRENIRLLQQIKEAVQ